MAHLSNETKASEAGKNENMGLFLSENFNENMETTYRKCYISKSPEPSQQMGLPQPDTHTMTVLLHVFGETSFEVLFGCIQPDSKVAQENEIINHIS